MHAYEPSALQLLLLMGTVVIILTAVLGGKGSSDQMGLAPRAESPRAVSRDALSARCATV